MNTFSTDYNLRSIKKLHLLVVAGFVASFVISLIVVNNSFASAALQTMVRFDRITTSTATTGTVCMEASASGQTEATVKVTFPTGYTLGVASTFTVGTTNTGWPSGAAAWPGIGTATNVTGQVVTFPSTNLTDSTLYCFNWINSAAVTTQGSASSVNTGAIETDTSTPTLIDLGSYSAPTISSNDYISVTATVQPSFSFVLSGVTDALGNLSSSSVTTSPTPRTVTINTNAANGWQVWAHSTLTNGGLNSATTAHTIASNCSSGVGTNSTLTTAAEGYNTGVELAIGTGSGSVSAVFARSSTPFKGGGLCSALQTLATGTTSATGAVLTLYNNAAIVGTTPPAADYIDTINLTGAGLF
jgi:hypothetical protein